MISCCTGNLGTAILGPFSSFAVICDIPYDDVTVPTSVLPSQNRCLLFHFSVSKPFLHRLYLSSCALSLSNPFYGMLLCSCHSDCQEHFVETAEMENHKQSEAVLLRLAAPGPVTETWAVSMLWSHQNQNIVIKETNTYFALFQCFFLSVRQFF